jgi:hypothetical protein
MIPKWETIIPEQNYDYTQRLEVPGGWLVCRIDGGMQPASMAMSFISDPEHTWDVS